MASDTETETVEELRERLNVLESAMKHIIRRSECDRWDEDDTGRCNCAQCEAKRALATTGSKYDWRYRGSFHRRIHYHPREARMIRAVADNLGDGELSNVLFGERGSLVTARDWYVAVSIMQWLATNVGMEVLACAGFKYQRWEEDRELMKKNGGISELTTPNRPKHGSAQ